MANAKPVAEVRIGAIKAAIWKNEAGASTRHNVTFQRIYKDGDDGWKTSQSFGRDGPARPGQGRPIWRTRASTSCNWSRTATERLLGRRDASAARSSLNRSPSISEHS